MDRLRAPQENHAIVAEPPLHEVGALLEGNRQLFQQQLHFFDVPWLELRRQASQAALAVATAYLQEAREPVPNLPSRQRERSEIQTDRLILAGHQPELFHPGVWIKNFALCRLAQSHGAVPLNLVVDSDSAKPAVLHVPQEDHLASVPFDHWRGEIPYEERTVEDEALFASLPEQTAPLVRSWPFVPMLPEFWQDVLRQRERTPLLGERLVSARRSWERRWRCHNFEVPLSKLCQTEPFAWFACHLLHDLARFHAIYNQIVHAYRRQYGIRSRFHPVPDLAMSGDWLEAPFWIWARGQTRRERLFARLSSTGLHLRCGNVELSLPSPQLEPAQTAEHWLDLERRGFKIRTRALTTTMYARLLIGDTFLHGIGGGKYDELTDVLIHQFYGVQPPRYMVLSATLLLPLPRSTVTTDDARRLAWETRDAWWNPQRHVYKSSIEELATIKQSWIDRPCATAAERRDRFLHLREITAQMRSLVEADYRRREEKLNQAKNRLAVEQILNRRDFAFCLYPEKELRPFMTTK